MAMIIHTAVQIAVHTSMIYSISNVSPCIETNAQSPAREEIDWKLIEICQK